MIKYYYLVFFILLLLIFKIVTNINTLNYTTQDISYRFEQNQTKQTLFPIQCIDTMKVSRDRAREKMSLSKQKEIIEKQVKEIASMGANCIAIGTPYNEEFINYLKLWVSESRKYHLHVWFRGNWSEWEGWFSYPKNLSTKDHLKKTSEFIEKNKDLFEDGDIFTPAPESENGGPFQPFNSFEKQVQLRQFLIDQHVESTKSFKKINKNVVTNWLSLSGGVAKITLDSNTINQLDNIVTLDHYVPNSNTMSEYISYFTDKHNSGVVLGEFGAPIPDLNGTMTDSEQSIFVDELFQILYEEGNSIKGVNYWTLSESSTSLLDMNGNQKKVVEVLKKYYIPSTVTGKIKDTNGLPIRNTSIRIENSYKKTFPDRHGQFSFTVPAKTTKFIVDETNKFEGKSFNLDLKSGQAVHVDVILRPQNQNPLFKFKSYLKNIIQ